MAVTFTLTVDDRGGLDTSYFFPGLRSIAGRGAGYNGDAGTAYSYYSTVFGTYPYYYLRLTGGNFSFSATNGIQGRISSAVLSTYTSSSSPEVAIAHLSIDFGDSGATDLPIADSNGITPDTLLNALGSSDPKLELVGNDGADTLYGSSRADLLDGRAGADVMIGRGGNDTYVVDNTHDQVVEAMGEGADTVQSSITYTLPVNVERLILTGTGATSGTGNGLGNLLTGNRAANSLNGAEGNDTLIGGGGRDALTGGAGADLFVYKALADSPASSTGRDFIRDFSHAQHDRIDLHQIDANSGTAGDQAFHLIGAAAFTHHAGELQAAPSGSYTVLSADVNGDAKADFSILVNKTSFVAGDFVL